MKSWLSNRQHVGCFSKWSKWQFSTAKNPKLNYLFFQLCILLLHFLVAKKKSYIHKREIGKGNFRRHQRTHDFRLSFSGLFQIIRHRASLYWHVFLERRISIAFFCQTMWFYETEIILVRFSSLCFHLFHLVYILPCATHGFRSADVLICRAETSYIFF